MIIDQNNEVEAALDKRKAKYLNDFNEEGDDVKTIDTQAYEELGRYEKFEKSFPFYKMDVNGFMVLIKRAMRLTFPDNPEKPLYEIKHITHEALQ